MSHRAEQVIDAVVAALSASSTLASDVYRDRVLSLNEDEQELPAVSVTLGDDAPIDGDGASNLAYFDSLIEVVVRIVLRADDEQAAISALLDRRRSVHVALMADRSLGLGFVIDTRYGGASAPELQSGADRLAALMDVRWTIHYRMGVSDPS